MASSETSLLNDRSAAKLRVNFGVRVLATVMSNRVQRMRREREREREGREVEMERDEWREIVYRDEGGPISRIRLDGDVRLRFPSSIRDEK